MQTFYVVGKMLDGVTRAWSFEGIYSKELVAVTKCLDKNYFVGPVEVNKDLSVNGDIDWPKSYYPKG